MRQVLAEQKATQQQASDIRAYVTAARQAAAASAPRSSTVTDGISTNGLYPIVSIREAMRLAQTGNAADAVRSTELLIAARAVNDPTGKATWDGANLPTADATNTNVEIVQTQSRAVLSWDRFDIGANTTLNFKQQQNGVVQAGWIAVNRVVDSVNPTTILGKLTADAQVYILNNLGVIFGKGSQVNLRSLVASSLELGNYAPVRDGDSGTVYTLNTLQDRNADFLTNGPFSALTNRGLDGSIDTEAPPLFLSSNVVARADITREDGKIAPTQVRPQYLPALEGDVIVDPGATITAATGGSIILAAPKVENGGILSATDGQVSLVAGRLITFRQLTGDTSAVDPQLPLVTEPNVRGLYLRAVTTGTAGNAQGSYLNVTDPLQQRDTERDFGTVINRGLIESKRGYLSLVTTERGSILNEGLLAATTSVSRNGKIGLYGGFVTIGGADAANAAGGISILPDDNVATLADGSTAAATIPQGSDAEPANFKRSQIEIGVMVRPNVGASVDNSKIAFGAVAPTNLSVGKNALIYAPNAMVTNAFSVGNSVTGFLNSSVSIGEGATIDVAGLKDVAVDVARNFVTITPVKRNELRDTPNYREVAIGDAFTLNGTTLTVDIRRTGVRADGVKWVGSPLIEAGSIASQIPVTVSELMTKGGDINFAVNGLAVQTRQADFTLGKGASINVSGGWERYDSATVATSKLVTADGRIVDIGNADPNDNFVSVYNGFTDLQPRFGVSSLYANPIATAERTEAGYDEGRDAGSLLIDASATRIDGTIVGNAFAGFPQAATAAKPTSTRTVAAGDPRKLQAKGTELPSGAYVGLTGANSDFIVYKGTLGGAQSSIANSLLSDTMLSNAGLSALTLNTTGAVTFAGADVTALNLYLTPAQIAAGVTSSDLITVGGSSTLTLAPGATLAVSSGRTIRVDGTVSVPSGTINLATTNTFGTRTEIVNAAGNVFRNDDELQFVYATGSNLPSLLDIGVRGTLSAAGLWVNDYLGGDATLGQGKAWINGGSINLTTASNVFAAIGASASTAQIAGDLSGSIDVRSGSLVDVSAGGYVRGDQSFDLTGKGGNVALTNNTVYARLTTSGRNTGALQFGDSPLYGDNQTVGFTPLAGVPNSSNFDGGLVPSLVVDPSAPRSHVSIADGSLSAFGFTGGGTFKLVAPDITFGSDAARTGATQIGLDFIAETGFGAIDFTSNRSLIVSRLFDNGTNYNSAFRQTTSFIVRNGETLDLTQTLFPLITARQDIDALLGFETGGSIRTLAALTPTPPVGQAAFDRKAVNLTIGGISELVVEQGGTISGAVQATIQATKLVNAGTIALPGGTIRQSDVTGVLGAATRVTVASLSAALGGPVRNGQYSESALNAAGIINPVTGTLATNAQLFTTAPGSTSTNGTSERNIVLGGVGAQNVGIELRTGSLTDLSGTALYDPRARFIRDASTGVTRQVRSGTIVGGGSIVSGSSILDDGTLGIAPFARTLNILPGAIVDISGARATFDRFVPSQGYVEQDEWSVGGRIAALGGGSLAGGLINAFGGYADDSGSFARTGTIDTRFATPEALGGTLEWLRPTLRAVDPGSQTANTLFANSISNSGFDTLIARNGLVLDGAVDLRLDKALIVTPNVTVSGALVIGATAPISATSGTVATVSAPYLRFESAARQLDATPALLESVPTVPGNVTFAAFSFDSSGRPRSDLSLGIDFVGTNYFGSSIGTLSFVTPGDIRFIGIDARTAFEVRDGVVPSLNGQFVSFADTLFDAGRVYATTGTGNLQGILEAEAKGVAANSRYNPYLILAANNKKLTFGGSYINTATPLTAGSFLRVEAGQIVQNGHLAAPIGRLEIGTRDAIASGALARNPTTSLTFGAGSLTTVGGGATPVPYGTTLDLKEYFFTPYSLAPLTITPVGQLALRGATIDVQAGATVDLKGGGDVFAYEFVSGVGGSRDLLSRTNTDAFSSNGYDATSGIGFQYPDKRQVYAIIPKSDFKSIAPFDPVLSADYGASGPSDLYGANAGLSVFIDGSADVPAGEYVLLPAHYALLDGKNGIKAYRIVENVGQSAPVAGQAQTLLDGSAIVSGQYGFAGTGLRDSTVRSFSIQSSATFKKSSRIETTSGTATVKAIAERAGVVIPRLPTDTARVILSPLTELKISGFFDTTTVAGAKGAQVDITGDRIIVAPELTNGQPTAATTGQLTLIDTTLARLNADSLFIGGVRSGNADGTTELLIDANTLVVKSGVNLAAPELLFAVGNQEAGGSSALTIEAGATLRAKGSLADPTASEYVIRSTGVAAPYDSSGAGSVVRLANGPERLIKRVGDAADENTLGNATLTIGAATLTGDGVLADNLAIDTSRNFTVADTAVLGARNIALSGDTIVFNGTGPTSIVRPSLLSRLSLAERLTLRSPNAIQFGDASVAYPAIGGTYSFNDLVIDAPSLTVIQSPFVTRATNVAISARDFRWSNTSTALPSCLSFVCGRANTSLSVAASGEVTFGGGTLRTLSNGGHVQISGAKGIFYEGVGKLDTGNAALSLVAPFIADRATVADPREQAVRPDFTLASNAGIAVTGPVGSIIPALDSIAGNRAPGARLTFDKSDARTLVAGQALDIVITNALIEASAGTINLNAERNLTLTGTATIAAPGYTKRFGDALDFVTVAAPGGALNLSAGSGNIAFIQGVGANNSVTRATLISDSGAATTGEGAALKGAAGSINLIASSGAIESFTATGVSLASFDPILNPGVAGARLGNFTFDSGTSAFDLSAFIATSATLFGGDFSVRSGKSDLTLAAGQVIEAETVSLTADGGAVTVAGTIDTSGIDVSKPKDDGSPYTLAEAAKARVAGGKIGLYGQSGVTLAATGRLDTHSSGYADLDTRSASAGDVTIGIGNAAGAALVISPGAIVDVSATRTEANRVAGFAKDTGRFVADGAGFKFVEADTGGKITLRAPLIGAAMNTVDVRLPSVSAFVGADEVQVAGVRTYDLNALKGTLGIAAGAGNDIVLDPSAGYDLATPFAGNLLSTDFVTAAGLPSIPNFIRNFRVSAADGTTSLAGYRLRPDVELVSSGAISLNSNWNLAAATVDQTAAFNAGLFDLIVPLSTLGKPVYALKTGREADLLEGFGSYKGAYFLYRVDGKATGEAPLINLRARGDVTISRSISDGFFVFHDRSDAAFINYQLGGGDRTYNPALTTVCSILAESSNCANVVPYDFNILVPDRNYLSVRINIVNAVGGTQSSPQTINSPYSAAANNAAALGTALDTVTGKPVGASLEFAELFPTLKSGPMRSSDIAIVAGSDAKLSANPYHVDASSDAKARVVDGIIGANGQAARPEYRLTAVRGKASLAGSDIELEFSTPPFSVENYTFDQLINTTDFSEYSVDLLDESSFAILNWGLPVEGSNKFAVASCAFASATCKTGFFDGRQITGTKALTTGVIAPLGQILAFLNLNKTEYLKRVADGRIRSTVAAPASPISFKEGNVVAVQTVVRTGTGAINIAASTDIDLRDSANVQYRLPGGGKALSTGLTTVQTGGTSVYTAGERVRNVPLTGRYADGTADSLTLNSALFAPVAEAVNLAPTPYAISYRPPVLARGGGDVDLRAGRDVLGRSDDWSLNRVSNPEESGLVNRPVGSAGLAYGNAGTIGLGAQLWRVGNTAATELAIASQYFTTGIGALAGGDVSIIAGNNISDLTVALDTSATTSASARGDVRAVFGSGNLALQVGNDLQGGQFDVTAGQADIAVANSVTNIAPILLSIVNNKFTPNRTTTLRLENATAALTARGDATLTAFGLGNGNSNASAFSDTAAFGVTALGTIDFVSSTTAPPSLSLTSIADTVRLSRGTATSFGTVLASSPIGQLSILAARDLAYFSIVMNDGGTFTPGVTTLTDEVTRRLQHDPAILHKNDFEPVRIFTDGSITNTSINLAKQASVIAGVDIVDSLIVGQNVRATDSTRIVAGRDITSTTQAQTTTAGALTSLLPYFGRSTIIVGGPGSVSVEAGRDIGPFATSALARLSGGINSPTILVTGGIYTVGNEYNPWLPAQGADLSVLFGVAPGIDYATLRSTYLDPANAAKLDGDLFVQIADAQGNLSGDRTKPIYAPILASWLRDNAPDLFAGVFGTQGFADDAALAAAAYGKAQALYDAFSTLDIKRQQPFLIKKLYFNELEQASLPTSPSFQQYIRGYRAIEALFPTKLGYTDNLAAYTTDPATVTANNPLGVPRRNIVNGQPQVADRVITGNADLRFAAVQTARGGEITIMGPGGDFLAGSVVRSSEQATRRSTAAGTGAFGSLNPANFGIRSIPAGYEGILTLRGGSVRYFTDGDLRLNQSRLFTNATGDISAWSSNGDLNAGQGPKSAGNFPPVTVRFDLNGFPVVDTAGGIVGAGIGAFKQSPADPNSRIILIAPVGEVDAGDAGVRASGDVFVAAARVANADNFSAGGTLSGVPSSAVAAAPAVPASAGSALAAIIKQGQPKNPVQDASSLISVDILGYAGGDVCLNPQNNDPNCPK